MRWKLISMGIFLSLILLEFFFPFSGKIRESLWGVERYFYSLSGAISSFGNCVRNPGKIPTEKPRPFSALSKKGSVMLVWGKGKKGDLLIDESGRVIGIVEKSLDGISLVETPLSPSFKLMVEVEKDGIFFEGKLIGGDPPIVEVPDGTDLEGGKVYISRAEKVGEQLREKGIGEIGEIIGKKKEGWIMMPHPPSGGMVILER